MIRKVRLKPEDKRVGFAFGVWSLSRTGLGRFEEPGDGMGRSWTGRRERKLQAEGKRYIWGQCFVISLGSDAGGGEGRDAGEEGGCM